MQAPPGQMTATLAQALLKDGALAGDWVLDPRKSSINRADFGLTWNQLGLVSMNNTLTIHAVFTRR
jgi:hypothetical protein